ncbi:MAG: prepilin-type N-terminal cleavage/methylation domain-containing protein [Bacteriovoracaceae bacterium]|nr:prepilin-type N-terminal cleavage/methylation domain-containing protein [Bacteriovoracaceae bacterium]
MNEGRSKQILRSQDGLTLLEILIAITIMTFLIVGVYTFTNTGIDLKNRTIKFNRNKLQVEAALYRIDQDFTHIYNPLFYTSLKKKKNQTISSDTPDDEFESRFEPTERFPLITKDGLLVPIIDNPDKKTLIFMSGVNKRKTQNSKQSSYSWIKYVLRSSTAVDDDKNPHGPNELIRYYSPADPYAPDFDWDSIKPAIMLRDIKSFEILYWDEAKEKFVERLRELDDKNILRSIKIKLTLIYKNKSEYKHERIFRSIWPFFNSIVDEKDMNEKEDNDEK